jgi:anthranilate/para-aminobenzoate synthase component II
MLEEPWIPDAIEFVRNLELENRKMLGVCFGHQLIAHTFNGKVRIFIALFGGRVCLIRSVIGDEKSKGMGSWLREFQCDSSSYVFDEIKWE